MKDTALKDEITFARLSEIAPAEIAAHMSDPRLADHMPLLTSDWGPDEWGPESVARFVALKEQRWARDGLGHWAILSGGRYVGWGGFQKEGEAWDFGLVLRPQAFGLGVRITRKAIDFAIADPRIPYVTFLLPPSRTALGALKRLGARPLGETLYDGTPFLTFRLDTV